MKITPNIIFNKYFSIKGFIIGILCGMWVNIILIITLGVLRYSYSIDPFKYYDTGYFFYNHFMLLPFIICGVAGSWIVKYMNRRAIKKCNSEGPMGY